MSRIWKAIELHYWIFPFALFLVLRLFSGDAYYFLGGDQCTFLELGRTFPRHQLFNHELYLIHPPPFGYAIGLFNLFLPLLVSGLAATLLFACINFFAIRSLARRENLPRPAIFAGLIYVAVSRPAVAYDYHVARVSILVSATALAILAFLRLLEEPSRGNLLIAIVANSFCLFVSDQGLLLLPCEAVIFLMHGSRRQWRQMASLSAVSGAVALCWPVVRLVEFYRRVDLPAGISGTIEFTQSFSLLAMIQPNFLPFTNTQRSLFTQTSLSLANLDPALLAALPRDVLMLTGELSTVVIVILLIAAFTRAGFRWRAFQWLLLSLLFLLPVGLGMNEWYGMGFIVPFAMLMAEGAAALFGWASSHMRNADKVFLPALAVACVVAIAFWLTARPPDPHGFLSPRGGAHFLFTRPPVTRGTVVSNFFASMPRDVGIMAPTDLSPEIVYLTDKRVVALPFDPALLDRFVDEYRISYLVTSSEFLRRFNWSLADQYTSSLITRSLFDRPQRYTLVKAYREESPAFSSPLEYYIFQVKR